ncbi:HEXXH motif domain-containing protein [Actinacidiphila sp. ITFR-21]|uniref:HEXXH motif domain-containing protein n=1 Tax=Actinacidiphila sp. ITFR-21 TaxID=3075199 RepID=UPI00288ADA21|nr:HEXXH motif domain-containing protein [Streptomyces sp. ITFR-21]WNI16433.1 HEXXH motif domain-containing protein [Streptomyces sp. ITFR-21]
MQPHVRAGAAPTAHHRVPVVHFDELAAGRGGAETVRFLRTTEYSRRLLLLRALLDAIAAVPGALGPTPSADDAWDALTAAQEHAPEHFKELLLHPSVGIWLGHGLRRLSRAAPDIAPLWADLGHVHAVCAVAALRAGLPLHTTVPLRDGTAMFPMLGLARLPGRPRWSTAKVTVAAGRLTVDPDGERVRPPDPLQKDARGWMGLRRLRTEVAGRPLEVWLDDIDPYRNLSEPVTPRRLSHHDLARWQEALGLALRLLAVNDPIMAAAVGEGLSTVAPLPPARGRRALSASADDGFGGLLASLPPDPLALAVTVVHEFQHTKLGALLHLLTLEEDDGAERHHAPWRDDPRPLSGLLQGAYAFLGVTEFWARYLDTAPGHERPLAEFEFALRGRQTEEVLRSLAGDPGLTGHGRRFVAGMAGRLAALRPDDRVRPAVAARAEFAALDHRTGWRVRHWAPAVADVRALAAAFAASAPADRRPAAPDVVPDLAAARSWRHPRTALIRRELAAVGAGSGPLAGPSAAARAAAGPEAAADRALLAGDPGAADAYARLVATDPEAPDPWTGLVLSLATGAESLLLRRPELPRAVHRELRAAGVRADPRRVALWLTRR